MDLKFHTDVIEETLVVCRLDGRITLSNCSKLRDYAKDFFGRGLSRFVFDVSELHYIDSSGLGTLLSIFTAARNQGGNMILVNPGGRVKDTLTVTKMYTFIPIHATVDDAVRFLAASPAKEKS